MSLNTITHAAAAVAAVAAGLLAWCFQEARLGVDLADERLLASEYRLDAAEAHRAADARVRLAEQALNTRYQGALNAAPDREALLRRELDQLRAVSDGLREQAADAARRLASAPPAAVLEYATAVNAVYDDCRAAYGDMAAKAEGHAADARVMQEAWPH